MAVVAVVSLLYVEFGYVLLFCNLCAVCGRHYMYHCLCPVVCGRHYMYHCLCPVFLEVIVVQNV